MPERNLTYRISAKDDASAVTSKIAKAAKKDFGAVEEAIDDTRSAGKRMADALEAVADDLQAELDQTAKAADELARALGPEFMTTVGTGGVDKIVTDLRIAGLSFEDIEADADELAAAIKHVGDVSTQAAGGTKRVFDDVDKSVRSTEGSMDRTGSVFANFTGNAVQDLPGVSGQFGALNVAAGQFVEYATEGSIGLRNLAMSLGPIAAITVAIGAVTNVVNKYAKEKREAAEQTREFVDALRSEEPALDSERVILDNLTDVLGQEVETALRDAGTAYAPFVQAVQDGSAALDEFANYSMTTAEQNMQALIEEVHNGEYASNDYAQALVDLVDSGESTAAQAGEIGRALKDQVPNYQNATTEAANLDYAEQSLTGTTKETAAATEDTADAFDDTREALDSYTQAIQDWETAVTEALPNELDLREAVRNSTGALAEYMTAMADVESTDQDRAEAADGVVSAWLDQAEAAGTSAEDQATAAGRAATAQDEGVAAQIWTLTELMNTLGEGSPLRADIEGHIAALGRIPRKLNTDITISGNAAGELTGARQHGGPVRRGGAYLVGEAGPEVVVPSSAGQVVPNDRLGGAVHLHVYGEPDEFTLTKLKRAAREAADEARRSTNWSIG